MLLCQDFGGSHDAALEAIVHGYEHGHKCDQGLPAAHISLEQAVHLSARTHVAADLLHDFFLGAGEFKGEVVLVKGVKAITYFFKYIAPVFIIPFCFPLKDVQLDVEKLFELEPQFGLFVLRGTVGKVDLAHGTIQVHELK